MLVVEAIVLASLQGLLQRGPRARRCRAWPWCSLLGTLGIAAVGTLFAAMTAQVRARELLFPVLLLPVQVPVLLATVKRDRRPCCCGEPLAPTWPTGSSCWPAPTSCTWSSGCSRSSSCSRADRDRVT